ncbi:MAG: hypothetical protein LBU14_06180 [Candidatus Peribacteria bacterium]|nr:hypothetical protein [Candidatus Peribacteria bacterium]
MEPHPTSPYQGEEQTLPLNKGEQEGVSNLTLSIIIPENTDLKNSIIELIFSNSRLAGIEKILKNLIEYPY